MDAIAATVTRALTPFGDLVAGSAVVACTKPRSALHLDLPEPGDTFAHHREWHAWLDARTRRGQERPLSLGTGRRGPSMRHPGRHTRSRSRPRRTRSRPHRTPEGRGAARSRPDDGRPARVPGPGTRGGRSGGHPAKDRRPCRSSRGGPRLRLTAGRDAISTSWPGVLAVTDSHEWDDIPHVTGQFDSSMFSPDYADPADRTVGP